MLIEFEVRPLDSRVMEAWQMGKFPLSPNLAFVLYLCWMAVGIVYAYRNRGSNLLLVIIAFGCSYVAAVCGLRMFTGWRFRRASGMVEGQHSMHFSVAGVHHVGPHGVHRYPWTAFQGVDVTVWYLLFRFKGHGAIAIPVSALEKFGQSYDEAFLMELAPMMEAAQRES